MLRLFRSKKSSLKWTLWIVILALGAGMLLLFVNPPTGPAGTFGHDLAVVCGRTITISEFQRQYRQMIQQYEQQFNLSSQNPELIKQLRLGNQALNQLISEYAASCEAERLGLVATDQDISKRILSYPVFQEEGSGQFIGVSRYQQILQANQLTAGEFEEGIRRQILREKLVHVLTDGIEAEPEAIEREYTDRNQQSKVRYVSFAKDTVGDAEIDEEELKAFFESNSSEYTIPEQRQVKYLSVPVDPDQVEIDPVQVEARISEIPESLQIRASHILFRVPPSEDDSEARKKATDVLGEIRRGADFAEMAHLYSEDDSAPASGDLGFFDRGQMVREFSDVAYSLAENAVSEPVKTPFGIHLIKTTVKPSTVEESRRLVAEFQLKQEEAEKEAADRSQALVAELKAGASVEDIAAREADLESGESGYFGLDDAVPELGVRRDFVQQIFALEKGETNEPYQTADRYVIATLTDIKAARMQKLEDIQDQVEEDYRQEQSESLARDRAQDFFRYALKAGSLEKAASELDLPIVETGFFAKGATVDDALKFSPLLHDRVATMKPGEISPPITVAEQQIVFELVERTELDLEAFAKEKERIAENVKQQERNQFLSSYLQNTLETLRKENRIQVNQDLLDALTG